MSRGKLCSVVGCNNAHHAYTQVDGVRVGLCPSHRTRVNRTGTVGTTPLRTTVKKPSDVKHCQVTGCCQMLKPGSLMTDNGRMWVCGKHRSRYEKYKRFDR